MSTRLVRKCQCGRIMIVEVDKRVGIVNVGINRSTVGYEEVICIEGCCLELTISGTKFWMPVLNKDYIKGVFCNHCYSVRHLNKFEEFNV